jgi:hypothetical protein
MISKFFLKKVFICFSVFLSHQILTNFFFVIDRQISLFGSSIVAKNVKDPFFIKFFLFWSVAKFG